jgi:type II secretory pathway pseudopilin PulG
VSRHGDEGGYSVVELLAAITIFAMVFAAVSFGISSALDVNRNNRNRSVAAYLAARQLEEARGVPFDSVAVGQTVTTATAGGADTTPYTVTQDVSWVAPATTSSSCNVPNGSSGAALAYKRLTVRVTWPDMRGVQPVASQTLLTPPVGAYDPNDGHIAVQLFDRNAAPLAGQPVTLSGPAGATQLSTGDGCAFFAYLDPGTYTVSLATAGYVDRQGDQPATQTAAVQASQITTLSFDYDQAATVQVGLVPPPGAAVADGIAVTVANPGLAVGTKVFAGSGLTRTVGPLFPYASGYQVWAGDCTDADPQGYPGGSRGPTLATDPGGNPSSTGTAALAAVDVAVRQADGTPVAGATVQAVHAAGPGCPSGETLTTTAVTDAAGNLLLALPYGTWTLEATSPAGTTQPQVALDPGSATIPTVTVTVP